MIRDLSRWRDFEDAWIASQKPDYAQNLRIFDGMYELARKLGKFTTANALDGIENDIQLAATLRRVANIS